ncbi:MAG: prephenate dehydrogenase [Ruminococcus sp.]|nr:prephenate dehydrogenase [Ruminococcus sp.]
MKIGIVGLGLIGGSMAKAIKKNTDYPLYGYDIDSSAVSSALQQEAIDGSFKLSELNTFDFIILGLYPDVTINFVNEHANDFKDGAVVIDTCGVKQTVVSACEKAFSGTGVQYLGCHPMAGREYSGFEYSLDNLFEKASFIYTPTENTPESTIAFVTDFAKEIGFLRCTRATPKEHDEVIAFTSQLAHVVSSAYVKSPSLEKQFGFSAGSFKDLTRVAKLNEGMWTTLFLMNKQPLVDEIDHIIYHLTEYKQAIENDDADTLRELLKRGRELKEFSNDQNSKQ